MAETPEKKARYWCFDGSSWGLIEDPLPPGSDGYDLFQLVLGEPEHRGPRMTLWARDSKPECMIDIFRGGDLGGCASVYADRLPDGIDLFARWAPAIYAHGSESKPST